MSILSDQFGDGNAIYNITGSSLTPSSRASVTALGQKTDTVFISEFEKTKTDYRLLIVRGDPSISPLGYINTASGTSSEGRSDDPDAIPGSSAHIVISRALTTFDGRSSHRTVLEQSENLPRNVVRAFLNAIIENWCSANPGEFYAEKEVGPKKKRRTETTEYVPMFVFSTQPNKRLKDELKNGQINGFRLLDRQVTFTGADGDPKVLDANVGLKAVIEPSKDIGAVHRTIEAFKAQMPRSWDQTNLVFEDETGAERSLSVEDGQADLRYIKSEKLIYDSDVPRCSTSFHSATVAKFEGLVSDSGKWG